MSQEIYDDLGQLGSLVMLGTMVASVDGSFEESEFAEILKDLATAGTVTGLQEDGLPIF